VTAAATSARLSEALAGVGDVAIFGARAIGRITHRPLGWRALLYQILQIGVRSLPMALTMAGFSGMVLAFQFGWGLERFGAKLYIGQATVTGLVRELGPILTALVVGARVDAGIAAELGGMAVTEQIDAVRALGADPLQRLALPRILAVFISLPLLATLVNLVGTLGAMLVAKTQYGVTANQFIHSVYDFVTIGDLMSGIVKTLVFGLLLGVLACYFGMRARGGTEGVGRAATRAVVAGGLSVLIADFFLTRLLLPSS
jgi:phospholipid/cholesterol/gamma-HCH transport system permease protein